MLAVDCSRCESTFNCISCRNMTDSGLLLFHVQNFYTIFEQYKCLQHLLASIALMRIVTGSKESIPAFGLRHCCWYLVF